MLQMIKKILFFNNLYMLQNLWYKINLPKIYEIIDNVNIENCSYHLNFLQMQVLDWRKTLTFIFL